MNKKTMQWLAKVAAWNQTTVEEVLRYLRALSRGDRVIHHLRLA